MPKSLPPLSALRAFERAAALGSFTQAAQELHITQSAVSKHVKTLEEHFGCLLFIRRGHLLEVTGQGRLLAQELHRAFRTLETACRNLAETRQVLRLKAPSSLTMSWLLGCLQEYGKQALTPEINVSSVWMDTDRADFDREPFDCAVLLGNGRFGETVRSIKLFDEWLVPVCAPGLWQPADSGRLDRYAIIHPSPDKRDWRRWLAAAACGQDLSAAPGLVFDALEQAAAAAMAGHGITIGDLALCAEPIKTGRLVIPVKTAVQTGDAYYLVWPEGSKKAAMIDGFYTFLRPYLPDITAIDSGLTWKSC